MTTMSSSAFAGSIPENYDRYLGPVLFEPYALDLVGRVDALHSRSVLEIACGTGRVTRHLKSRLASSAKLVATDLNPDMIAVANRRLREEGGDGTARDETTSIEWQVADAQVLPFADGVFDLLVCQFGVMFFPDKAKAFAEMFRVLKAGGVLLFNTWDRLEANSFMYTGVEVVKSFFTDKPPIFFQVPFAMYEEEGLRSLCQEAGFKEIQVERVTKEGGSPSARDLAMGMVEGNPVSLEIQANGEGRVKEVIDAVERAIASAHGAAPVVGTLRALVCRAEKPLS